MGLKESSKYNEDFTRNIFKLKKRSSKFEILYLNLIEKRTVEINSPYGLE